MSLNASRRVAWLLLALSLLANGCNKRHGLQIDDPLPAVTLPDWHGKPVNLPGDLQGKVLLIRFWSLECTFCDKEMLLELETLYQKYKARGFVPVAVNAGKADPNDPRLQRFANLTYPMLMDERGLVGRRFGVIGMPTSFVIDKEGVLKQKITGEAGLDEFEKLVTTVLY